MGSESIHYLLNKDNCNLCVYIRHTYVRRIFKIYIKYRKCLLIFIFFFINVME